MILALDNVVASFQKLPLFHRLLVWSELINEGRWCLLVRREYTSERERERIWRKEGWRRGRRKGIQAQPLGGKVRSFQGKSGCRLSAENLYFYWKTKIKKQAYLQMQSKQINNRERGNNIELVTVKITFIAQNEHISSSSQHVILISKRILILLWQKHFMYTQV